MDQSLLQVCLCCHLATVCTALNYSDVVLKWPGGMLDTHQVGTSPLDCDCTLTGPCAICHELYVLTLHLSAGSCCMGHGTMKSSDAYI